MSFNRRSLLDGIVVALALCAMLMAASKAASAQICNIPVGSTASTMQTAINNCAAYSGPVSPVVVTWAAGTFSVNTQLSVTCPNNPMVLMGVPTNYPIDKSARPTSILNWTGGHQQMWYWPSCSVQRTREYLESNGGQPATGGGSDYLAYPQNHVSILYNYIHGNEENYPMPCINNTCAYNITPSSSITSYTYDDTVANLIQLTGATNGTATNQQNILIQYNVLGNPVSNYPLTQWVSTSTSNLGVASSNGDCVNVQQWEFGPGVSGSNNLGYNFSGGNCVGIAIRGGGSHIHVYDNVIQNQEQGGKNYECGQAVGSRCLLVDLDVERNDISGIHRIGWENQQTPMDSGATQNAIYKNNVFHNPKDPSYGQFSFSLPVGGTYGIFANSNLTMTDCGNAAYPNYCHQINSGGASFEWWGSNGSQANYNLMQGSNSRGVIWGFGGYPPTSQCPSGTPSTQCWQAIYNTCEGATLGTHGNPGYCVVAEGNQTTNPPLVANTAVASSPAAHVSAAPNISPGSGSFNGSQLVTLTDAGFASSTPLPQGNTSIWYTIDGSAPGPHSGTSQYYTGPFSVSRTTTVKAVGMWGSPAQPDSYTTNFGFLPSSVVSATYSTSGTPVTLVSVGLTNTGNTTSLNVSQSIQMTATCTYSDSSTTNCNTTDAHGNAVSTWASSNPAAVSVSSSGLASAVSAGSASVTATVAGYTSPGFAITVLTPTLSLTSVSLATTGGATSIVGGAQNQLIATCGYSDSSSTNCTTVDVHGNDATFTSTAPSVATVNAAGGFVTGIAAGSTNLQASVQYGATQSKWGQTDEDTTGYTSAGYINSTYFVFGTQSGGYSPTGGTCSFYLPTGTLVNGSLFDCGLIPAPSPTTQGTAWQCWGTYTVSGTSAPGAFVTVTMNSCGTSNLAAGSAWWVGVSTNASGHPNVGFDSCSGGCSGAAPTQGNGTYPYRTIAVPYGTRGGMATAMSATGSTLQASQYVALGQPAITSNKVTLTVTAAPPALVSAYLAASSSTMTVGGTLQFAARCVYSDSSTTDCTVADIHGNAVTQWATSDETEVIVGAVGSTDPGLATAIAAGTLYLTASVGSITSTQYPLTVAAPAVTLTGISLATTGGVTGLFLGSTNHLVATCLYSDGSTSNCTSTDSHGDVAGNYLSSNSAAATVDNTTGLVTAIAPGTTTFTATSGSETSNAAPVTILAVPTGVYTITISGPVKFSGSVRF